jgi:hypothetical protein
LIQYVSNVHAAGGQQLKGKQRQVYKTERPDRFPSSLARRACAAMAWVAGGIALFVLLLRVSLTHAIDSDGANITLQAWDMLHGHVLLHGWILSDVPFYAFDIPMIAVAEAFLGLHTISMYVATALDYLVVAACAVAIAVTDARGASRVARAAVVVAVLAAPVLVVSDRWITLGHPDHTGSAVFLLVCCLLIDRASGRRFTAPLLCVILCVGQISDPTVRYVFVPAITVVCAYRALAARESPAARKFLTDDGANLVAALASVPLSIAVRAAMRHLGAYLMVAPKTQIAPVSEWGHNAGVTWHNVLMLFGVEVGYGATPVFGIAAVFGLACLLASAAGLLWAVWRLRVARRAEQVLVVAIAVSLGVYLVSRLVSLQNSDYIVAVLPSGAVLAARALVPARLTGRLMALAVPGAALVAGLLPLSLVAAQRPVVPYTVPLAMWLQTHGLRYGLAGYWDGSVVTLEAGNQVQVRTVVLDGKEITPYAWETNFSWFDPALHYANFVIVDLDDRGYLSPEAERVFGKPARTHRIGNWDILIYQKNLLTQVKPASLPPTS